MEDPGQAIDCEVQTVVQTEVLLRDSLLLTKTAYCKDKGVGTADVTYNDVAVEANYVEIVSLCRQEDTLALN